MRTMPLQQLSSLLYSACLAGRHACLQQQVLPSPPTDGRRARAARALVPASLDAAASRLQATRHPGRGGGNKGPADSGGGPASRGVKPRRRSGGQRGWTVIQIATGWTVFEIPSTLWVPATRPIELGRPRLDPWREPLPRTPEAMGACQD